MYSVCTMAKIDRWSFLPALVGSPTAHNVIFFTKCNVRPFLHILYERTGLLPCLYFINF
jgi:hypothetical protein